MPVGQPVLKREREVGGGRRRRKFPSERIYLGHRFLSEYDAVRFYSFGIDTWALPVYITLNVLDQCCVKRHAGVVLHRQFIIQILLIYMYY